MSLFSARGWLNLCRGCSGVWGDEWSYQTSLCCAHNSLGEGCFCGAVVEEEGKKGGCKGLQEVAEWGVWLRKKKKCRDQMGNWCLENRDGTVRLQARGRKDRRDRYSIGKREGEGGVAALRCGCNVVKKEEGTRRKKKNPKSTHMHTHGPRTSHSHSAAAHRCVIGQGE